MLPKGAVGPIFALATLNFPNEVTSKRPLLMYPSMSYGILIPIGVTLPENICSQTYWDLHVQKFGIHNALKNPQVINASVSTKKFAGGEASPSYTYEWITLTTLEEQDRPENMRPRVEDFLMKALSAMTPEQREEQADIMKRDMVADLYALLNQRDKRVSWALLSTELLLKKFQRGQYIAASNMNINSLKTLVDVHKRIIAHILNVEHRAEQPLPDVRQSVATFHRDLIKYVTFLQPKNLMPGANNMQTLLQEILAISTDNMDPPPPPPTQEEINATLEAWLTEADTALKAGDEQKCRDGCINVLTTLNASSHSFVRAECNLPLCHEMIRIELLRSCSPL